MTSRKYHVNQHPAKRSSADMTHWACDLCEREHDLCNARTIEAGGVEGYLCTRVAGHTGSHAACGSGPHQHPIFVWRNELIFVVKG